MLDQHPNANSNLKWDLLRISVEQGDITKGISDVIIIPCDENLQCNSGVARAVIQAGGALLQDTIAVCALETNGLEHAQPVISPGCFNLDTGHIVLVYSSKTSVDGLTECYKRALEAADDRLDATIVTLAPFGTGGLKARPEDSAAAAFKAIFDCGVVFNKIQSIRILDINRQVVDAFRECMVERAKHLKDAVLLCGCHNINSEIVEDKEEEDIKKIADKFFKVVPSPEEKMGTLEAEDVCAICYDSLFEPAEKDVVVQLRKCGHIFHRECVKEAFTRVQVRCPMCKRWYSAPKGNQPTGSTMIVTTCEGTVPGFPDAKGYFFIEYSLPGGIQTEEHPRPGLRFSGVRRYAYLPNTIEGEKVLRLFKLAFINRLMFTVGDRETGRRNVVIFNGIETKSTLKGGPKMSGFPDPDYLPRVKVELAAVGITEQLLETLE